MQPSASFLPRRQEGAGSIASPSIHWAMQPLGYPSMKTLGPKKDISISISYAYPTLLGFIIRRLYGISLSSFLLKCFWGALKTTSGCSVAPNFLRRLLLQRIQT